MGDISTSRSARRNLLFAAALLWTGASCAHAPESAEVSTEGEPKLPACSVESRGSNQPGTSQCLSITLSGHGGGAGPNQHKVFLKRPPRHVDVLPVYKTHQSRTYSGRQAQLQTLAYETLCHNALSEGSTKPPPRRDDEIFACFGPSGAIEVVLVSGETKVLEYDSELYERVSSAWGHMASAIAWTDCAPPDR